MNKMKLPCLLLFVQKSITTNSKCDVDQDGLSYLLVFYLNKVYLLVFYSILSLSLLCELGFFVSLLFGLVFFRRLLN
jgi:hypothetical protein